MLKRVLFITVMFFGVCVATAHADDCGYWRAQIDPEYDTDLEIDESKPENVLKGIECLLKLEGNKGEGLFSGATSDTVSQIFPVASIEVCALYYSSYLFHQDWKHASAVALVEDDGAINSDRAVKKAFKSYRLWLRTIKRNGLERARKQNLDPLKGSGVRWY